MRAQFVMSEIGIGLRRNLTMTIAVVVSVALSLALAGAALLLRDQVSTMKGFWDGKIEVSVYFCNKTDANQGSVNKNCSTGAATQNQIDSVQTQLQKTGLVLHGWTETYHAKQVAQHAAMQIAGVPILANEIEVK